MAFSRGIDGPEHLPSRPVAGHAGAEEERRATRTTYMAAGSLACPECDAPVALGAGPVTPGEPLRCPFCGHTGPTRAFLSLAAPTRPAHVEVHVRMRPPVRR